MTKNCFNPIHTTTSTYNQFAPVKVGARSVPRTLKTYRISNFLAVLEPHLPSKNLPDNLIWAKHHDACDDTLCDKVVSSDESSYTIRPTTNKGHVWRKSNTKFNLRNLVPTFKSSYITVSVRGTFSANGRTTLVHINGTLKQENISKFWKKTLDLGLFKLMEALLILLFSETTAMHIEQSH